MLSLVLTLACSAPPQAPVPPQAPPTVAVTQSSTITVNVRECYTDNFGNQRCRIVQKQVPAPTATASCPGLCSPGSPNCQSAACLAGGGPGGCPCEAVARTTSVVTRSSSSCSSSSSSCSSSVSSSSSDRRWWLGKHLGRQAPTR